MKQNRIPAGGNGGGDSMTPEEKNHLEAFKRWVRNPRSSRAKAELEDAENSVLQTKGVTLGTDTSGGHAAPEIISRQINKKLRDLSVMRQICRVDGVQSSDMKYLVDVGGTSSGWVGETDSRSETTTPELQQVAPTFGVVYAYPTVTEEAMEDIFFDVQRWLVDNVAEELAIQEGAAFISGNGSNKPTGFLDGTPVSTGDDDSPGRSFGTIQYIPTGVADGFELLDTGSPQTSPADVFLDTVYTLKAGYRQNAVWLMNSATAGVVRKFKDADGRYLWQDSLQAGEPALLCGYPVRVDEQMPDIAADAHPIAFGDFRRAYVICDSFGLRLTVDDNITTPGYVKFYVRKRVGGKLLNDDALKLIKIAAS